MTRYALAGLLAIPALLGSVQSAAAQCFTCMSYGNCIHQHGPLYNYTPGYGGYGCGRGCYNGGNHAPMSRGGFGDGHGLFHGGLFGKHGCGACGSGWGHGGGGLFHGNGGGLFHKNDCNSCGSGGWGHYALSTFRNVFHRCHPCGGGRSGGCSTGTCGGCTTCSATAPAPPAAPATPNTTPPATLPKQ